VGTGFGRTAALELRRKLDDLHTPDSPFAGKVAGAGRQIHWVRPRLVVEIAFTEMTSDGKLRHPSFQGLREDKPASEVVRESPQR
jgi:bifunctional non-homologous end joining protein LigD